MRISTKGRHAVMAMVDLARHAGEKPVPLADVAQRQMISLSYLEQLVAKLKKNGLVKSMRGPGGGYVIAMDATQMTIQQIVSAVDTGRESDRAAAMSSEGQTARKLTDHLWDRMSEEMQKYLKSVTLADVVQNKI
ncbi:MAG: Rrf2 family transcriptional regulator [Proteobacteria bacterium]|nr:Rrf2 family transcriptional regulator [Alphaproteobacteria bacterium]NCC03265.1 Rrf2 family transcriptional regulator [Pseudomonadota bacterium]